MQWTILVILSAKLRYTVCRGGVLPLPIVCGGSFDERRAG